MATSREIKFYCVLDGVQARRGRETNPESPPSSDGGQSLPSVGVFGHPDSSELLFWVQAEQQLLPLLGRIKDACSVSAVGIGG